MKARDVLSVSADAIAVGGTFVGVAVLAVSYFSDKLAVGLAVALALSVIVNSILLFRLRGKTDGPAFYDAVTAVVQTYKHTPEEREAAKKVIESLDVAMDRFDYDWSRGLDSAGEDARKAALTAKSSAEVITDATIRGMVAAFTEDLMRTPRGWYQEHGATQDQMDRLRRSHDDAVQAVGSVLRPTK